MVSIVRRAAGIIALTLLFAAAGAQRASAAPELHATAMVDDSTGDNNGVLEPGESALVVVTITNTGDEDATTVAATVSTTTSGANVTDAGPKSFGTVAANDSVDASFGISLDASYACGNDVTLDVAITSDQGPSDDQVTVSVPCPAPMLEVSSVSLTDPATHDPVTAGTLGRLVDVSVVISNTGTADATNVSAHLSGGGATFTQDDASYGTIAAGAQQAASFQLIPSTCPQTPSLSLDLNVTSDQSTDDLGVDIPVDCVRLGITFVRGTFDDRVGGNGDGVPQPGETGLVFLRLMNVSDAPITGIRVSLDLNEADVTSGSVTVPEIQPGETADSASGFTVTIHADARLAFQPEPTPDQTPSASVTTSAGEISAPSCSANYPLAGLSLDDSVTGPAIQGIPGISEFALLHVTADQGSASISLGTTAVCAVTLEPGTPEGIADTGGIRFGLLFLALGLIGFGVTLRRIEAVKS